MVVTYSKPPSFSYRIMEATGSSFATGALGSTPYHFFRGATSMPKGSRIVGGLHYVRINAPRTAGSFAVWCAIFTSVECAVQHFRGKDDPWNSIIAGATTGGVISIRQGPIAALKSAVTSGLFFAIVEGVQIVCRPLVERQQRAYKVLTGEKYRPVVEDVKVPVSVRGWSSGWLGRWLTGGMKGCGEPKVWRDFDSRSPMFKYH